jgi:hypothetical protein
MTDKDQRTIAETVFDREQRRERELSDALRLEEERHAAVVKNMQRLRELRLARDAKIKHLYG